MTRPTEKQLADVLREAETLIAAVRSWTGGMKGVYGHADDLAEAIAAYRSAQQAEAGAARSESVAFSDVFAPIFEALAGSAATDIVKDAARLAAAHAWEAWQARAAASSAQEPEPGWVMVPAEPSEEMLSAIDMTHSCNPIDQWRAALAAAPTRMAGASQGEAVAWARMCTIDDDDGRAIGIDEPEVSWGAECPDPSEDWSPLYAHPQAQGERKPRPDAELAELAYRGFDDYWTEDSRGEEKEAWARSARTVLAAHGIPTASTASDEGSV